MMEKNEITMTCFACAKVLSQRGNHGHPSGALCFQGSAPYGSIFDCDHQYAGLTGYEIYICDGCWGKHRVRALGLGTETVTKTVTVSEATYVSGDEIERRFKECRESWDQEKE